MENWEGEEREAAKGLLNGLWDFLKTLEEMEKKGQTERIESGELAGPFGSRIGYKYRVMIGKGFKPGKQEVKRGPPEPIREVRKVAKEPLVDVFDKGRYVLVTAELPGIRKEDIATEISENRLRVKAITAEGVVERNIEIPEGSEIDKIVQASFRNNILAIKLRKKRKRAEEKTVEVAKKKKIVREKKVKEKEKGGLIRWLFRKGK